MTLPFHTDIINTDEEWIEFWLRADVHFGHEKCRLDLHDEYWMEWVLAADNRFVIDLGDIIEASIPSHMPQTMIDQIESMERQYEVYKGMVAALGDKLRVMIRGNHEYRIWRSAGFDICRRLVEGTKVGYLADVGYYILKINPQGDNPITYKMLLAHPSGTSTRAKYAFEKARKNGRGVDCDAMLFGHIHKLYCDSEWMELGVPPRKFMQTEVRCGSFLDDPSYVMRALGGVEGLGNPIMSLSTTERLVKVDIIPFGVF